MKLYTRTGDDGTTGLIGGGRVRKDDVRIQAIGEVDELNSVVGMCVCVCDDISMRQVLVQLQHQLFDMGADLASVAGPDAVPAMRLGDEVVKWTEEAIDAMCADVPPIRQFVLPGGTELAARLHLARAVCRRAERAVVALARQEPIDNRLIILLNRVSDLLFAMARRANHQSGTGDVVWRSET